jgi:hypothetical protein
MKCQDAKTGYDIEWRQGLNKDSYDRFRRTKLSFAVGLRFFTRNKDGVRSSGMELPRAKVN